MLFLFILFLLSSCKKIDIVYDDRGITQHIKRADGSESYIYVESNDGDETYSTMRTVSLKESFLEEHLQSFTQSKVHHLEKKGEEIVKTLTYPLISNVGKISYSATAVTIYKSGSLDIEKEGSILYSAVKLTDVSDERDSKIVHIQNGSDENLMKVSFKVTDEVKEDGYVWIKVTLSSEDGKTHLVTNYLKYNSGRSIDDVVTNLENPLETLVVTRKESATEGSITPKDSIRVRVEDGKEILEKEEVVCKIKDRFDAAELYHDDKLSTETVAALNSARRFFTILNLLNYIKQIGS